MMENFVYMDESNIHIKLRCNICKNPFVNPVSFPHPCEQTFCLQCIQLNLQNHPNHCSACQNETLTNEHLHTESRLRKIVDDLPVRCSLCNQDKIQRIQFEQHLNEDCPKQIVSCPNKDVECQWTGYRDQLHEHIDICPYRLTRDHLTQLIRRREPLEQLQNGFKNLQDQFQEIENEKQIFNEQIKQIQLENQNLNEQTTEQMNQINQLNEQIDQLKPFETENQLLNEQLELHSIEIKKLEEENQLLNKEITQLKEIEIKDLMKQINELNIALNRMFQENLKTLNIIQTENGHFRQLCQQQISQIDFLDKQIQYLNNEYQKICQQSQEQQIKLDFLQNENQSLKEEIVDYQLQIEYRDIKIKQLQTRPLLQPKDLSIDYDYENNQLKELINQYERNSLINLNGEQLNDHDIDIVINYALAYKKCHSILLWNNSLTTNSTAKLFSSLKWNKTLTKLSISNNPLADISMKYLCEALAYDNQTLQDLSLSSNEISDQGLIYFSDVFKSNQTLITIGLQNNRISDHSIQHFSKILLAYQNGIENLSLYSNELITDLSVQSCLNIIEKKIPLKTFWIWGCQLSNEGKDQITQSIQPHFHLELRL